MKAKKKATLSIMVLAAFTVILLPLSAYRNGAGYTLVQNNIFSAKAEKKSEQVLPPSEDKQKDSDVQTEDLSEKKSGTDGEKKAVPGEDASLYDYSRVEPEPASTGWMFFKFFLIVALLLTGFYFFFRFVSKKTGMSVIGRSAVDVISAVPVGQNKFIQIIDVAGKMLVLGVTDSNINLLTEITEKDQKDKIRLQSSKSSSGDKTTFQQYVENTAGFIGEVIKKTSEFTSSHKGKGNVKKENLFSNEQSDERIRRKKYAPENNETQSDDAMSNNRDFYDFIDEDKMNYLKRQKDRLKRLNGFENE
ncbi:MAG: flagellar biosynthetic protein FliO [Spirochaetes bacterium]|nr:flagellar biosynthetic protein FliO [Spirochaetota bacterium]